MEEGKKVFMVLFILVFWMSESVSSHDDSSRQSRCRLLRTLRITCLAYREIFGKEKSPVTLLLKA